MFTNGSAFSLRAGRKRWLKEQLEETQRLTIEKVLLQQTGYLAQSARFLGLTQRVLVKKSIGEEDRASWHRVHADSESLK